MLMNYCLLPPSLFLLSLTILTQLSGGHYKLTSLPSAASQCVSMGQTSYLWRGKAEDYMS